NERKPRTVQVPANRPAVAAVAPARSVPPPARPAASAAATAGAPDNRAGGPVRMLPTVSSGAAPGPVMAERPPGPFGRPQTLAQIRPEGWRAPVVVNHPQGPFGFLFSFFRCCLAALGVAHSRAPPAAGAGEFRDRSRRSPPAKSCPVGVFLCSSRPV